jgi:hypothetical protein
MTIDEFVAQEERAGAHFHRAGDVWWQQVKPFYCVALPLFRKIRPGDARPPQLAALAGYEHPVPDDAASNAVVGIMTLEEPRRYELGGLSAKRRGHVRRGLRSVSVRRIESVEVIASEGHRVNVSAIARMGWGGDRRHYTDPRRWAEGMRATFNLPDREGWGAFVEGRLVAYLLAYELEHNLHICALMSHSDALSLYPNDALLHTFLESCRQRAGIGRVVFGYWCAKPSLNEFKQRFGFRPSALRLHRHLFPGLSSALRFTRYRHYLGGTIASEA